MINHHDVLVGLIDRSGRLRTGTDGRAAVLDGRSGRLYLRPLEKLGKEGREERERREKEPGQTFWGEQFGISLQYYNSTSKGLPRIQKTAGRFLFIWKRQDQATAVCFTRQKKVRSFKLQYS